jgi:mRNA interferase HigB
MSHYGTYDWHMKIVSLKILKDFWERYPETEHHLKAWVDEVKHASWQQPADIKAKYRNASILKNRRIVFNIKGNEFRLIVAVAYRFSAVYIKFIGTHRQYDAIDAQTIELE